MIVQKQIGGLTLTDAVVVVAVGIVTVALIVPAVQNAREAERETRLQDNFNHLGVALHVYTDTYRAFPTVSDPAGGTEPDALPEVGEASSLRGGNRRASEQ